MEQGRVEGRAIPTEVAIGEQADKVAKGMFLGRAVLPTVVPADIHGKGRWFQGARIIPTPTISSLDEEIAKLHGLAKEVETFRVKVDRFTTDKKAQLNKLSIFKPWTWCDLLKETLDFLIISVFSTPLISFGTLRSSVRRVEELQESIDDRLVRMKEIEIRALSSQHKELKAVSAYHLLGRIVPQDRSHLPGIAQQLFNHRAYKRAATLCEDYLAENRRDPQVHQLYVLALKGAMLFDKAHEVGNLQHDPEYLVAKNQYKQARCELEKLPRDEEIKKKLVYLYKQEGNFERAQEEQGEVQSVNDFLADFILRHPSAQEKKKLLETACLELKEILSSLTDQARLEWVKMHIHAFEMEREKYRRYRSDTLFDTLDLPQEYTEALKEAQTEQAREWLDGSQRPFSLTGLKTRLEQLKKIIDIAEVKEVSLPVEI